MGGLAYGLALALAVLFVAAAVQKVRVVRAGAAGNEPLVARRPVTARHARPVLLAAAAVEAVLAAGLVLAPRAGLLAAAVVLLLYANELRHIDPDATCHCFAATSMATARTAIVRDVALAVLAVLAAVWGSGDVDWLVAAATLVAVLGAIAAGEHVALSRPAVRRR